MNTLACRTVVVYLDGIDGQSGELAVLKSASLGSVSSFVAPSVYSITRQDNRPVVSAGAGARRKTMIPFHSRSCQLAASAVPQPVARTALVTAPVMCLPAGLLSTLAPRPVDRHPPCLLLVWA